MDHQVRGQEKKMVIHDIIIIIEKNKYGWTMDYVVVLYQFPDFDNVLLCIEYSCFKEMHTEELKGKGG